VPDLRITVTLTFDHPVTAFALVVSGWFAAGHWRENGVEIELRPGGDLFPRLSEDEIDALFEQIIDASLVAAPIQRNRRTENAQIKDGEVPADWPATSAATRLHCDSLRNST
jgi:hypothetical protein